jgi:topoisomerase-4 subunit A
LLKYQEAEYTLDTALVFTNKGTIPLYIPVHKLADIKWKDLGQHVSQIVPIDEDEHVIDAFCESDFKPEAFYILATTQWHD